MIFSQIQHRLLPYEFTSYLLIHLFIYLATYVLITHSPTSFIYLPTYLYLLTYFFFFTFV
jgi:hypothetical protein